MKKYIQMLSKFQGMDHHGLVFIKLYQLYSDLACQMKPVQLLGSGITKKADLVELLRANRSTIGSDYFTL